MILKKHPILVLSGDLLGDLNMWNIKTKRLQYSVPEPCTAQGHKRSLFCGLEFGGGVEVTIKIYFMARYQILISNRWINGRLNYLVKQ